MFDHYLVGFHSIANAGKVGYFKDECKCHLIVQFLGLRPTMYSFTAMDAEEYDSRLLVDYVQHRHKELAKGIVLANIKQFTYDEYVTIFLEGDARKVTNRRIGSKL